MRCPPGAIPARGRRTIAIRHAARPAALPRTLPIFRPGEISPSTCHGLNQNTRDALTSPSSPFTTVTAPKARGNLQVVAGVTKKPDLPDPVLRAKLAKGIGHNYYGEPAWPSDLPHIFPVP